MGNSKIGVSIKPNTYIYFTLLLLIFPLDWVFAWIIAALFHEICHWVAVKICGGEVLSVVFGLGGAEMYCGNMPDRCRMFSVLCGPFGGLILIFVRMWFPKIALCSLLLSAYNLLPLLPLDGGQVLRILIRSDKIFYIIQKITLLSIVLFAIYATFILRLGIFPGALVCGLYLKNRNYPCKERICRVQ